jgi:hypothetical protein
MDWNEHAYRHEFTLALAQLQPPRQPLWRRAADWLADLFWRAAIPALSALRNHDSTRRALRTVGAALEKQPRAFRLWLLVFFGWVAGLSAGILWALIVP